MKILIFIVMFFALSGLLIISNNGLALYRQENRDIFLQEYSNWLEGIYSNSLTLTGYVVKLEWLPKERANNDKS